MTQAIDTGQIDQNDQAAIERTMRRVWCMVIMLPLIVLGLYATRWVLTDYYVATHCTTVLGTRVCHG